MSNLYLAIIRQTSLTTPQNEGVPVAELAFRADNPDRVSFSVLEAAEALGLPSAGSGVIRKFDRCYELDGLPSGKDEGHPDWSDRFITAWLIRIHNQPSEERLLDANAS